MNTSKISPEDPRLTAFALNEMEPSEHAEFAALLQDNPDAQAAVAEIRAAAESLGAALASEPAPVSAKPVAVNPPVRGKVFRFPQLYFVVSGLAAACFAVIFVLWEPRPPPEQKKYIEVALTQPAASEAAAKPAEAPALVEKAPDVATLAVSPVSVVANETRETSKSIATLPGVKSDVAAATPPPPASVTAPDAAKPAGTGAVATNNLPVIPDSEKIARLDEADKPVTLSPFTVEASEDTNYTAKDTLAGTRVTTSIAGGFKGSTSRINGLLPSENAGADGRARLESRPLLRDSGRYYGAVGYIANPELRGNERIAPAPTGFNTETYSRLDESPFLGALQNPLSTFSVDVDTAAYANLRRYLLQKQQPPRDLVRIEELVNYFPYHYQAPPRDGAPFAANLEVASAPWAPEHRLVRIGLKGREISDAERPTANLVFLLDVSGSMDEPNKLPLVKQAMRLLVDKLHPDDRVAIVTYAGASGLALPSTPAKKKSKILHAVDGLRAYGSTNGEAGIQLAYDIAKANFVTGGINRVILATDGDFNVGVTGEGELTRLLEEKAKSGVFLTVLGFGMGNYKDAMLVKLADKGNGNYAYIDTLAEAHKALVEQAGGTLMTIAKDVKIQVEFNPAKVQSYRLLGYEKRALRAEEFNDDKVDAGEMGSGHAVTALYEVVPTDGAAVATGTVDPLKYQNSGDGPVRTASASDELLTLKVRYKEPAGEVSNKLDFPLRDSNHRFEEASADFKFTAAVAAFGMVLRDSPNKGSATLAKVEAWARSGLVDDAGGYRSEFVELVKLAGETAP